ncbi:MAG: RNA polymerase sigma-70 factor [Cyclobacteriaceae bacterium]
MNKNASDIAILTGQIKSGDLHAFEKLYHLMSRKVFRYAFSFIACNEEAEEIMQDVFLKIWDRRQELKEDTSIDNFIYTIARNATLDRIRRFSNENARIKEYFLLNNGQSIEHPYEQHYGKELEKLIVELIAEMPPRRKHIFELHRFQGMSYKAISEYLNITPAAVEKQISKALQNLREGLQKHKVAISIIIAFIPGLSFFF